MKVLILPIELNLLLLNYSLIVKQVRYKLRVSAQPCYLRANLEPQIRKSNAKKKYDHCQYKLTFHSRMTPVKATMLWNLVY